MFNPHTETKKQSRSSGFFFQVLNIRVGRMVGTPNQKHYLRTYMIIDDE